VVKEKQDLLAINELKGRDANFMLYQLQKLELKNDIQSSSF
jgi:hypothetical protein